MPLPSRSKQIEAVAEWLERMADADPPLSLNEIATKIVDGYHNLIESSIKKPVMHPHVGMAFKTATGSSVQHVAYAFTTALGDRCLWCVNASSRYGFLVLENSPFWEKCEMSTAKTGAPGNNPKWSVGDKVTRDQGTRKFEVVATGDKCVFMMESNGLPQQEPNDAMETYYRKELTDW